LVTTVQPLQIRSLQIEQLRAGQRLPRFEARCLGSRSLAGCLAAEFFGGAHEGHGSMSRAQPAFRLDGEVIYLTPTEHGSFSCESAIVLSAPAVRS